jgi:hypothetical protein
VIARNRAASALAGAALLALPLLAGCYPSNVIEESDRAVKLETETVAWGPLPPGGLAGAWGSERIEGDLAASLVEVHYLFHADGTYTGAGLVIGDGNPTYQTLTGVWELSEGRLTLDAIPPGLSVEASGDRIRLASETGTIVMRRIELQ